MQDITYLNKNNYFYILMASAEEEGKTEVLVIPCEKFPSMDQAWEKCTVYEIGNKKSFESFNHLHSPTEGVLLSKLGYFFTENFYNSVVKLVMQ
ncbi:hypothetical protein QJ48_28260 [Paenibacillus sp. A3]|uniref:hypothetical protein n=1 Tax=Paenibacillus sp. A3 TaxID=1337054 RepID=UPI0006D59B5E|nr:hypothetical protein [Paenibacillus sp. A3]KPV56335.1 hypothetical protein QJ48_28260 [Paenibacillus sp. A3]